MDDVTGCRRAPGSAAGVWLPNYSGAAVVRVHPGVLFAACDAYTRRQEGADRVIGTLLGTRVQEDDGVVVEVKECYTVPHVENGMGNVSLDWEFHKNMLELHQQVNAKEVVVGWFSTRAGMCKGDALLHDHFAHGVGPGFAPVLLTLDAALATGGVEVKAFTRTHLTLGGKLIASQFQEVACDVRMAEAERIGLGVLGSARSERIPDATEGLEASVRKLRGVLDTVTAYIDDVVAGTRKPNPEIGRFLMDTLAAVPQVSAGEFEAINDANAQDMYVIKYLVQLTKTQLFFSEKLRVASIL